MIDALDLFAGPGGWDVAARRLGVEPVGIEWDASARLTRDAAGLRTGSVHDVRAVNAPGGLDLLIASPPCQTFSMAGGGAGRRALDAVLTAAGSVAGGGAIDYASLGDERTGLVLEPLRIIRDSRPRLVALEQVPTVLPVWEAYAGILEQWGYTVDVGRLSSEEYGVPQTRRRAILVARLDGVRAMLPVATHRKYRKGTARSDGDPALLPWVSMADALGPDWSDALVRSNYGTDQDPANRGERHGGEPSATVTSKIDRNQVMFAGAGRTAVDTAGQVRRDPALEPAHTITGVGSAAWVFDRPATTIVGSFRPEIVAAPAYRTTVSRQNQPGSVRVTVEEAGVLQSFPADYPWQGSKTKQYQQVGNAIPPGLAGPILASLLDCKCAP